LHTSREVELAAERCVSARSAGYWVTRSAWPRLFPSRHQACSTDRPPTLSNRVHSLVPLLLFGVSSPLLLARPFGLACPAGGFVPLRDITARCPLARKLPEPPLWSVHRFSQPLDGLRHLAASRAYCIPQPRPGFQSSIDAPAPLPMLVHRELIAVQGVLPIRSRTRLIAGPCPRAVTAGPLTDVNRLPRSKRTDLGAFIRESKRALSAGV